MSRRAEPADALPVDLPSIDPGLPRFVVATLALALAGVIWLVARPSLPRLDESPAEPLGNGVETSSTAPGSAIFVAEGCGTCHVTVGPSTALQPSLEGARERAAQRLAAPDYAGAAETPMGYLREAILDHCADVLPGYSCEGAPEVGLRLGSAEMDALIEFVVGLGEE